MRTRHWTLVAVTVVAVGAGGACAEGLSRNDDVFSESNGSEGGGGEAGDDEDEGTGGSGDGGSQVAATTVATTTTSTSSTASSSTGGVDGECDHATHLACGDGECVLLTMVCNGITDCATGADEAPVNTQCPTQGTPSAAAGGGSCGSDFACNDGSCIPADYQCDGLVDCYDYEDEVNCPCDGFTCGNGDCIYDFFVCDGYVDCDDDEVDCEDTTTSSSSGTEVVPVEWTCNVYYYGDGYDCDCGCGVLDPDCETSAPDVCDFCDNSGGCSESCADLDPAQNWVCL